MQPSYYDLLGVSQLADATSIEDAFNDQMKVLLSEDYKEKPFTKELMHKLEHAFLILSNAEKKAEYDKFLLEKNIQIGEEKQTKHIEKMLKSISDETFDSEKKTNTFSSKILELKYFYLVIGLIALYFLYDNFYSSKAYYNRGIAYANQKKYDLAISDFSKAIELDPKDVKAYTYRGIANADLKKYDLAISDYNKAIKLDPKLVLAYSNRGIAFLNLDKSDREIGSYKEYDLAIADFSKIIALDPTHVNAYINRGFAYTNQEKYRQAIYDYTKAIALDPTHVNAYINRGIAYFNLKESANSILNSDYLKKYDLALTDYTKAIELDPKDALAYINRGIAYKAQNKYDQAIADYTVSVR